MSVAFRRESDDEHLEPRFELPIPPGPNLVTARGLALIQEEVARREAGLADLLARLPAQQAGSEDEAVEAIRRELRYWRTRQASAQVMPVPDGTSVEFGCRVRLSMNGRERVVTIVGDDEADPASGLLAYAAPLARAIMGAEEGERVDFAGKAEAIEVLEIRAQP